MAAVAHDLETPTPHPESPLDEADANILCKGCAEILEEGKAFELAGNRWHIDCFRCNTCGTLLDSDANLLLLGDGSLICNNCTYSCNACGNKIEDLAILTGDQAFCATCFRCRNCKKKIENLKYARTSQGIFCMSCHESLMARRRKRAKSSKTDTTKAAGPASSSSLTSGPPPVLDKSLPALPPNHPAYAHATSPDKLPASPWTGKSRLSPVSVLHDHESRRSAGPEDYDDRSPAASASAHHRRSSISSLAPSDVDNDDDQRGFLPMAIDTSLVPSRSPENQRHPVSLSRTPDPRDRPARDYFVQRAPSSNQRDKLRVSEPTSPHSPPAPDTEEGVAHLPNKTHVAFQDKARPKRRSASAANTPVVETNTSPRTNYHPDSSPDGFQLKDAPHSRSRKNSTRNKLSPTSPKQLRQEQPVARPVTPPRDFDSLNPRRGQETPDSNGINPFDDPKLLGSSTFPTRREVPSQRVESTRNEPPSLHERSPSSTSIANSISGAPVYPIRTHSKQPDSPLCSNISELPQRAAARSSAPSKSVANDDFIAPRLPPAPPIFRERRNQSVTSLQSDTPISPLRSQFSRNGLSNQFSMDDLRVDTRKGSTGGDSSSSVLRRMSNAMRHARSNSDKAGFQPHRKTSSVGQLDISGPVNLSNPVSPSMRDENNSLRSQLLAAQQRITDLENDKLSLEDKVNSATHIKNFNTELRERRSTMAYLDTQREMAVRELEVITEHLIRAKDKNQPFDIATLKNEVLHDLSVSLQRLKDQLAPHIEDLVRRRNELTDEITSLIQVKDKGLQEFESLSSKNNQLHNLNAQLTQSIPDTYKVQRGPATSHSTSLLNGLGIHNVSNRSQEMQTPPAASEIRPQLHTRGSNDSPASHMSTDTPELGEAHVLSATQMVNIRKGGQAKRFNWKKGGRDVAKNMTKGLKGAFARENELTNGTPYSSQPYGSSTASDGSSLKPSQISDPIKASPASLAFFHKNVPKSGNATAALLKTPSVSNLVVYEPSVLFGSELVARCDYENRLIPAVVTRCIQEVESRGMDVEGIYRKSGGTGQVQKIQAGFDRDAGYDISDPDLDIHAVTSCLKQYLRKLPNPLITFEAYDGILQSGEVADPGQKTLVMRNAIGALPQAHRDVLEFLLQHLVRVIAQQAVNLMTTLNISVVFAPTIMRPLSIEREMADIMAQRETIRTLLDNASAIFD